MIRISDTIIETMKEQVKKEGMTKIWDRLFNEMMLDNPNLGATMMDTISNIVSYMNDNDIPEEQSRVIAQNIIWAAISTYHVMQQQRIADELHEIYS